MDNLNNTENSIDKEKTAKLEAILFAYGEEMTKEKLAKIIGIEKKEINSILEDFKNSLEEDGRGLALIDKGERVLLATKSQFSSLLEDVIKSELKEDITPASVEVLSTIAYFGPISRAEIDYMRGVNSSFTIRNLMIRGLIERKKGSRNAYVYEITFDFLKFLGIKSVSELPDFENNVKIKEKYFSQEEHQNVPKESAEAIQTEQIQNNKSETPNNI